MYDNPLLTLSDLKQQIQAIQADAEAKKKGLEEAVTLVEIGEYPLAESLARASIRRRIGDYETLLEFCRNALLGLALVFLTSCSGGFKNYRMTETVRAARVGDKALNQWRDNYACPGCVKLPDGKIAHPGEWVVLRGSEYQIVNPADFRRKYRKQ